MPCQCVGTAVFKPVPPFCYACYQANCLSSSFLHPLLFPPPPQLPLSKCFSTLIALVSGHSLLFFLLCLKMYFQFPPATVLFSFFSSSSFFFYSFFFCSCLSVCFWGVLRIRLKRRNLIILKVAPCEKASYQQRWNKKKIKKHPGQLASQLIYDLRG